MSKTDGTRSTGNFIFKGADGSLGYKTGNQYHLVVFMSFVDGEQEIMIERFNPNGGKNTQRCIYSSSKAFSKNWVCKELYEGPDPISNYKQIVKDVPIQLEQILDNLEEEIYGKN